MADGQERPPRLLAVGEIEAGGTAIVDREPGPGRRIALGGEGAGERQPALAVGKIRLAQAVLPQEVALEAVPEPLPARRGRAPAGGWPRPAGPWRTAPRSRPPPGCGHRRQARPAAPARPGAGRRTPSTGAAAAGRRRCRDPPPCGRAGPSGRRSTARSGGPDRCRPAARTAAVAARGGPRSARARTPCPAGRPRPPGARPATRHSRHTAAPRPARPRALPAGPPGPGRAAPASAGPGCRARPARNRRSVPPAWHRWVACSSGPPSCPRCGRAASSRTATSSSRSSVAKAISGSGRTDCSGSLRPVTRT